MIFLWAGRRYEVRLEGRQLIVNGVRHPIQVDGATVRSPRGELRFAAVRDRTGVWVSAAGFSGFLEIAGPEDRADRGAGQVRSPMTGRVVGVHVRPGQEVPAGALLVVVTAMKMEYRLEAPFEGRVERVECREGQLVDLGQLLMELRPRG